MSDERSDRGAAVPGGRQAQALQELADAMRFVLAFYEPGQRHLDTEAWKRAEAGARRTLKQADAALSSSLAPGIPGIPVEQVQELREQFETYRATSQDAAHAAFKRRRTKDAYGRACEASTLAVIVSELDRLIASASAQGAASAGQAVSPPAPQWRPIAESVRKFADELLESGRRDFVNCEPSEWWTPDRMKTLAYGRSMLMVSIAGSLHAILKADPPASSSPTASAKGK
jgi:hypothetical protein